VDSASPSSRPTAKALAPNVVTINKGSKLWIISEEMSINKLTKPSTHTPAGILFNKWLGLLVMFLYNYIPFAVI
jgi:hypothetical protein